MTPINRCPNPDHEDTHPSASWNWKKSAWNCQACGDSGGWKRFCQLTGIPLSGNGHSGKASRRRLEHYDYPAADGRIRRKIRTEPKGFRWCVVDDQGNELSPQAAGVSGNPRCLYRLEEVREAIRHGLPVFVVEGEKAADRVAKIGLTATCNPEGAARVGQQPKWRESYAEVTASDLLSGEESSEEKSAEEEAREFLLDLLSDGRVASSDALKHAREDGIKEFSPDGQAEARRQVRPRGLRPRLCVLLGAADTATDKPIACIGCKGSALAGYAAYGSCPVSGPSMMLECLYGHDDRNRRKRHDRGTGRISGRRDPGDRPRPRAFRGEGF